MHSSDDKRTRGRLSRHGSPLLRWALFEAAKCAARPGSPDHAYYAQVRDRVGGNRAALSAARKITRWAHHTLRGLGDEAFAPVAPIEKLEGDRSWCAHLPTPPMPATCSCRPLPPLHCYRHGLKRSGGRTPRGSPLPIIM